MYYVPMASYTPFPFWLEDANLSYVALGGSWLGLYTPILPITTFNPGKHSTKKHAKTFSYTVTISLTCISGFWFFPGS
jgi:hypothetical protein